MTFKDILPDDDSAMLDLTEFAELVRIDGVNLRAVIENHTAKKSGNDKKNFKGLFGDFTEIFFRTCDYCGKRERLPRNGEICMVYSEEWKCEKRFIVEQCTDEMGMTHLILSAYRQDTLRSEEIRAARAGVLNDIY